MVMPNIYINQSDRKKCHCCEKKFVPGEMCIQYVSNAFHSKLTFRSSHLHCWMIECDTLPSQAMMEEVWKEKLLKSC